MQKASNMRKCCRSLSYSSSPCGKKKQISKRTGTRMKNSVLHAHKGRNISITLKSAYKIYVYIYTQEN